MYRPQEKPVPYRLYEDGELITPDVTLISEYGGVAHIDKDDSCYVLVLIDSETGLGSWTHHWFPEAVDVLKTLPTPISTC